MTTCPSAFRFALAAAIAFAAAGAAHADDASPWSNDSRSSVRLLAGWPKMPGERECYARFMKDWISN